MRRANREIKEKEGVVEVLEAADTCRVGMYADGEVYIVPLSFGYEFAGDGELALYFHCAGEGRKLDMIARNPEVCFEMDTSHRFVPSMDSDACGSTMKYASLIGWGRIGVVAERDEKLAALTKIMEHFTKGESFTFNEEVLGRTTVLRLTTRNYTAKSNI